MDIFLPSEIARLVLGYLQEENCMAAYNKFLRECIHLQEYVSLLQQGRKYPTEVGGKNLKTILKEYGNMRILECEKVPNLKENIFNKFDVIAEQLQSLTAQTRTPANADLATVGQSFSHKQTARTRYSRYRHDVLVHKTLEGLPETTATPTSVGSQVSRCRPVKEVVKSARLDECSDSSNSVSSGINNVETIHSETAADQPSDLRTRDVSGGSEEISVHESTVCSSPQPCTSSQQQISVSSTSSNDHLPSNPSASNSDDTIHSSSATNSGGPDVPSNSTSADLVPDGESNELAATSATESTNDRLSKETEQNSKLNHARRKKLPPKKKTVSTEMKFFRRPPAPELKPVSDNSFIDQMLDELAHNNSFTEMVAQNINKVKVDISSTQRPESRFRPSNGASSSSRHFDVRPPTISRSVLNNSSTCCDVEPSNSTSKFSRGVESDDRETDASFVTSTALTVLNNSTLDILAADEAATPRLVILSAPPSNAERDFLEELAEIPDDAVCSIVDQLCNDPVLDSVFTFFGMTEFERKDNNYQVSTSQDVQMSNLQFDISGIADSYDQPTTGVSTFVSYSTFVPPTTNSSTFASPLTDVSTFYSSSTTAPFSTDVPTFNSSSIHTSTFASLSTDVSTFNSSSINTSTFVPCSTDVSTFVPRSTDVSTFVPLSTDVSTLVSPSPSTYAFSSPSSSISTLVPSDISRTDNTNLNNLNPPQNSLEPKLNGVPPLVCSEVSNDSLYVQVLYQGADGEPDRIETLKVIGFEDGVETDVYANKLNPRDESVLPSLDSCSPSIVPCSSVVPCSSMDSSSSVVPCSSMDSSSVVLRSSVVPCSSMVPCSAMDTCSSLVPCSSLMVQSSLMVPCSNNAESKRVQHIDRQSFDPFVVDSSSSSVVIVTSDDDTSDTTSTRKPSTSSKSILTFTPTQLNTSPNDVDSSPRKHSANSTHSSFKQMKTSPCYDWKFNSETGCVVDARAEKRKNLGVPGSGKGQIRSADALNDSIRKIYERKQENLNDESCELLDDQSFQTADKTPTLKGALKSSSCSDISSPSEKVAKHVRFGRLSTSKPRKLQSKISTPLIQTAPPSLSIPASHSRGSKCVSLALFSQNGSQVDEVNEKNVWTALKENQDVVSEICCSDDDQSDDGKSLNADNKDSLHESGRNVFDCMFARKEESEEVLDGNVPKSRKHGDQLGSLIATLSRQKNSKMDDTGRGSLEKNEVVDRRNEKGRDEMLQSSSSTENSKEIVNANVAPSKTDDILNCVGRSTCLTKNSSEINRSSKGNKGFTPPVKSPKSQKSKSKGRGARSLDLSDLIPLSELKKEISLQGSSSPLKECNTINVKLDDDVTCSEKSRSKQNRRSLSSILPVPKSKKASQTRRQKSQQNSDNQASDVLQSRKQKKRSNSQSEQLPESSGSSKKTSKSRSKTCSVNERLFDSNSDVFEVCSVKTSSEDLCKSGSVQIKPNPNGKQRQRIKQQNDAKKQQNYQGNKNNLLGEETDSKKSKKSRKKSSPKGRDVQTVEIDAKTSICLLDRAVKVQPYSSGSGYELSCKTLNSMPNCFDSLLRSSNCTPEDKYNKLINDRYSSEEAAATEVATALLSLSEIMGRNETHETYDEPVKHIVPLPSVDCLLPRKICSPKLPDLNFDSKSNSPSTDQCDSDPVVCRERLTVSNSCLENVVALNTCQTQVSVMNSCNELTLNLNSSPIEPSNLSPRTEQISTVESKIDLNVKDLCNTSDTNNKSDTNNTSDAGVEFECRASRPSSDDTATTDPSTSKKRRRDLSPSDSIKKPKKKRKDLTVMNIDYFLSRVHTP